MNFLAAVNRILRTNGIIKGDDDDITTFSDVQHNATLNLAIIAVQDELIDLVSDKLIGYERTTSSITTSASCPNYSLAADFVQFYGIPHFTKNGTSDQIFEYPGGLEQLQMDVPNYDSQSGSPNWWYFLPTTTKQVAFYPTPDAADQWNYDYEKDVSVTASSDVLPFHNEIEAQSFCAAAGRRFKFLFEDAQNTDLVLANDASYITAKGRLVRLMTGKNQSGRYGKTYL